ncbi:hypothetical protein HK101_001812 [Irineochytrium annulatum]|nr:hypothetical protein HK101_001812 [Irineochytrium annulatum]
MPVLDRLDVSEGKCRIHIFGIKYDFEEFAPTYTIGGKLNHLIGLGAQFVNTMEVKILEPQEAAVLGEKQEGGKEESMGSRVAALMGQMTRLRMTNLSVVDKQAFFNFYMEKENKKRK